MAGKVIPFDRRSAASMARGETPEEQWLGRTDDWLRRQILEFDAIDLLATEILGYEVRPFHREMLQFQFEHPDSLQLGFRGSGKSTLCTITKAIHCLLKNPNLRILLTNEIIGGSEKFLREIKGHFENNERLAEVFGPYFDKQRTDKWDTREINVLPRTKHTKEASIACVGADGSVALRHVDIVLSDDLAVERNSRTKGRRSKLKTWYYQSLDPCLEPPDPAVPHRGEHHRVGTRYHWDDLYGYLIEHELKDHHRIYRGLLDGKSPWPEKYPVKWFEKKRKKGVIIFGTQYLCDTEMMKGEIFQYDDCQQIDVDEVPSGLKVFMGSDLAVGEKKKNDQFAQVAIGIEEKIGNVYVLEAYAAHLRFSQQKAKWKEMYKRHDPIRAGIESNGYQDVMRQDLKEEDKDFRVIPIHTSEDKITRGQKLSSVFEDKRMFFVRGTHMNALIDQLVLLSASGGHPLDDLFDALDIAVTTSRKKKRRKRRETEPGLM